MVEHYSHVGKKILHPLPYLHLVAYVESNKRERERKRKRMERKRKENNGRKKKNNLKEEKINNNNNNKKGGGGKEFKRSQNKNSYNLVIRNIKKLI